MAKSTGSPQTFHPGGAEGRLRCHQKACWKLSKETEKFILGEENLLPTFVFLFSICGKKV